MPDSEGEKGPRVDATIRVEVTGHEKPCRCTTSTRGRQQRLTSTGPRDPAARYGENEDGKSERTGLARWRRTKGSMWFV